jgi:hypothetical protein
MVEKLFTFVRLPHRRQVKIIEEAKDCGLEACTKEWQEKIDFALAPDIHALDYDPLHREKTTNDLLDHIQYFHPREHGCKRCSQFVAFVYEMAFKQAKAASA